MYVSLGRGEKRLNYKRSLSKLTVTVGIIGSSSGVGTTHLAIMLAGFLSSKEHKKTASIELNHAGAFSEIKEIYCVEEINLDEISVNFRLNGVDYYPRQSGNQLAEIFQKSYDYLIFDLGSEWESNKNEFLRCNIGCIVGSFSEWKLYQFERFVYMLKQLEVKDDFHFVTAFGLHKLKKNFEKKHHIHIDVVPFEPTPFVLHKETFAFFERLCM